MYFCRKEIPFIYRYNNVEEEFERKTYRVDRDTPLGRKLDEYSLRASECQRASCQLASSLHAVEYIFDADAEVSGIGGLIFKDGYLPDARHWDSFEADDADHTRLYVPKVQIRGGFGEESGEMELVDSVRVGGERIRIKERHLPYEAVMYRILDYDVERLTGINLRRQNILSLTVYSGVPADVVHRIRTGRLPISVLDDYRSEHIPALREAILSYQEVDRRLTGKRFFEYLCYRGTREAMDVYERMMDLPTIPCFTLNRLFDYTTDTMFRVSFEANEDGSFTVTELCNGHED